MKRLLPPHLQFCLALMLIPAAPLCRAQTSQPATAPAPGERIPSEDSAIKDFHSLGLINGQLNIFRSASPTRDLLKGTGAKATDPAITKEADARMKHLYDLGIRTIISLENADAPPEATDTPDTIAAKAAWIALEKDAATRAGIAFVPHSLANSGKDSMQDLSDAAVQKLLDQLTDDIFARAKTGGVLFHCAAGHDRTGITAAWLRLKYQHWTVDEAIAEMRRLGHNWVKYSGNGGQSSWHEDHLRALAPLLPPAKAN